MSLEFDDVDGLNYHIREFIQNNLTVEVESGLDVGGWTNSTDKLSKGESVIRIKLSGKTVSEHTL